MGVVLWYGGWLCGGIYIDCGCSCWVAMVVISCRCEGGSVLSGVIVASVTNDSVC